MESLPKVYYKIKEIANTLNVSESLIRFWEKELNLTPPIKEGKNNIRKYTVKQLDKFKLIKKLLREEKLTILGVKKYLNQKKGLDTEKMLVKLKELKDFFINIKNSDIQK